MPIVHQSLSQARQLLSVDLPANFTADFVILRDGQSVLIELNPYYSSGSYVPKARAWWLVRFAVSLATQAGYEPPDVRDRRAIAESLCDVPIETDGIFVLPEAC